jgi:hypothetical protein
MVYSRCKDHDELARSKNASEEGRRTRAKKEEERERRRKKNALTCGTPTIGFEFMKMTSGRLLSILNIVTRLVHDTLVSILVSILSVLVSVSISAK